jgi:hypothetical protein
MPALTYIVHGLQLKICFNIFISFLNIIYEFINFSHVNKNPSPSGEERNKNK